MRKNIIFSLGILVVFSGLSVVRSFASSKAKESYILLPKEGQTVKKELVLKAYYLDEDNDPDVVQWAVRKGTCDAGVGTVYGNVDGYNDDYEWDGINFYSTTDVSALSDGDYCFVFNPKEDSSATLNVRLTRQFSIVNGNVCATIQDGTLLTSDGEVITTGYDEWGYNYQAHMFNGMYCDSYRDADWCQPYKDDELMMKWNDAWLSNKDCDGDGLLDRHFDYPSYIGSGAWLTNHQKGSYTNDAGKECKWNYFVKIVAVPVDATMDAGGVNWLSADETEIGPAIWGAFAVIMEVYNDPCAGDHGASYVSPNGPGFGKYMP